MTNQIKLASKLPYLNGNNGSKISLDMTFSKDTLVVALRNHIFVHGYPIYMIKMVIVKHDYVAYSE